MNVHLTWVRGAALLAVLALAAGCDSDQEATTAGAPGATTVAVELAEYTVAADPAEASSGDVTFAVSNVGTLVHEFVVIATASAPDALPTDEAGDVDETAEGIDVVVEIEDLAAEGADDLTIALEPGPYVLICNIPTHYGLGMRTGFTVS